MDTQKINNLVDLRHLKVRYPSSNPSLEELQEASFKKEESFAQSGIESTYNFLPGRGEHVSRTDKWLDHYKILANQIVEQINPLSVLDAGCGIGLLVEALHNCGVEAFGFDTSHYAISKIPEEIRPFCWTGSVLDQITKKYDLIICSEILQYLPRQEVQKAIEILCAASSDIIFSANPEKMPNTESATNLTPDFWAGMFARFGFWRDLSFDASAVTPWAMRFRKTDETIYELVSLYEARLWQLEQEMGALYQAAYIPFQKSKKTKQPEETLFSSRSSLPNQASPDSNNNSSSDTQLNATELEKAKDLISTLQDEAKALKAELSEAKKKTGKQDELNQRQTKVVLNLEKEVRDLRNGFAAKSAEAGQMHQYIGQLERSREELYRQLSAFEKDLRALQSTRSVRYSRAAGLLKQGSLQLLRDLKGQTVQGAIDSPDENSKVSQFFKLTGWAVSNSASITKVQVFLNGVSLGSAEYGFARPDVTASRPLQLVANCGYRGEFSIPHSEIEDGPKNLTIQITDTNGQSREFSRTLEVHKPTITEKAASAPAVSNDYEEWITNNEPDETELKEQRNKSLQLSYRPLISIITPVYNPSGKVLIATIESVLNQTYDNWELCLADGASTKPYIRPILNQYAAKDDRIKVKFLDKNEGIAGNSNAALEMAEGEFIALLDHDDELLPFALYENALLLNRHPDTDMIYSDEDKLNEVGKREQVFFKPDWSPDLFRSMMYTCHLGVYRANLIKKIGGFRMGFDGAQDYDLVLRLIEETGKIRHIPKVLYHWRMVEGSTATRVDSKDYAFKAQVKAVAEHVNRIGPPGSTAQSGFFPGSVRVRYGITEKPKISIIIPTRDQADVLKQCVESIELRSSYQNYEIVIVDNNSAENNTFKYFEVLESKPNVRVLSYPDEFNFSAINNFAVSKIDSELVLFLNNDTEVITPDWLEAMVEHALRPEVGAVGARLLYPNNLIQHAGVIIGMGGVAGHVHRLFPADSPGVFGRAKTIQNFSAVTGACLMTRTEVFKNLGGFNSDSLPIAFNDVDYCLRVREKGLLVVWTPFAELYHHESLSRGEDDTAEKWARFTKETNYMRRRWSGVIYNDPYYNPNLSLYSHNFSIAPFSRYLD